MEAKTKTSRRVDLIEDGEPSSRQEILTPIPKRWRRHLGYCSVFAAVPAMLASHISEARADDAQKPEASVAGRTVRLLEKSNMRYSNRALLRRQSNFLLPHQKGSLDLLAPLGGTDDCPGRTIPGGTYTAASPYLDSGNTTGANDTIGHFTYYYYYSFDSVGPDQVYLFTLAGRGSNPKIEISTGSSAFSPLVYVVVGACPAGTGNPAVASVLAFSSHGTTTKTINSDQMNFLPLNVPLHLFIDSNRTDADGSGPYTVRMQDVSIVPVCTNQIDCAEFFVSQHYRDFLNRDADSAGLTFWSNEILVCGVDPGCLQVKRINVSAAFFLSGEFQETGYFAYRTYRTAYGNLPGAPVPLTFSEFLPDTQVLGQGVVVNQPGWELALENNKQGFTFNFVQRSRFVSAFPSFLSPTQFVDLLFANAGVTPSITDRAAAIDEFGSTSSSADISARSRALRRVVDNSALKQQELNRAFVLMQYFGYLRRNPNDAPEPGLNFDGYNFWLNKLNQFHGSFVDAEMVKSFITSSEYRQRFGTP